MSTDYCPNAILSKQTFELRMASLKIKQINAPLRFTKVLFVCLFKVINGSPLFKTKKYIHLQTKLHLINQNRHISLKSFEEEYCRQPAKQTDCLSLLDYHQSQERLRI